VPALTARRLIRKPRPKSDAPRSIFENARIIACHRRTQPRSGVCNLIGISKLRMHLCGLVGKSEQDIHGVLQMRRIWKFRVRDVVLVYPKTLAIILLADACCAAANSMTISEREFGVITIG
jgi:hypothetical protein